MPEWEVLDQDPIVTSSQWEVIKEPQGKPRPTPPKPRPKPERKPRQPVSPEQRFMRPLPPSIPEHFQKSQFRFETAPFRETQEQRLLRSVDPPKLSPEQRLRREAMLAAREGRPLVSMRASTPEEIRQDKALERLESLSPEMTTIYNVYQKGLGALGDISLAGVRGLAEKGHAALGRVSLPAGVGGSTETGGIAAERIGKWIEEAKRQRDLDRPPVELSSIASGKISGSGAGLGHLSRIGGSMVPLLAAGRLGMAVGIPTQLTSGIVGATVGVGSTAEEFDKAGRNKDRRDIALLMGGLSGATEAFGLERTLDKFGLGAPFRKAILGVAAEGGQGGVQRFLDNVNSIYVGGWDPEREVLSDVAQSALEETIGAAMVMGVASISEARHKAGGVPIQERFEQDLAGANIQPYLGDITVPDVLASDITPEERQANLDKFLEKSQTKIPLFHGTQSSTEISEIDPRRFDPSSLYGPGLYATQDPEIAGGAEGYAQRKFPRLVTYNEVKNDPTFRKLVEEEFVRGEGAIDRALKRINEPSPTVYEFYFDIRNAFDIDAEMSGFEANRLLKAAYDKLARRDPGAGRKEGYYAPDDSTTGKTLYQDDLFELFEGDKAEINKFLQEQGYDGITHVGGSNRPLSSKRYATREEAQIEADRTGGTIELYPEIVPIYPHEYPNLNNYIGDLGRKHVFIDDITNRLHELDYYANRNKYPEVTEDLNRLYEKISTFYVKGHRVWIAFNPEQVKSATGNIGTFDPTDPRIYRSYEETQETYDPTDDDLAFDVMPALHAGQAPYLRVPRWLMVAIDRPTTRGINFHIKDLDKLINRAQSNAPSPEHARLAVDALTDLAEQTKSEGINSLSIIAADAPEPSVRGTIEHELVHAGERNDLIPDPNWVNNHPLLDKVLSNPKIYDNFVQRYPPNEIQMALALEIPSHYVQGRLARLGITEDEGRQFFKDYINHIRTKYGTEGVDRFRQTIRLRPESLDVIDESDREWAEHISKVRPTNPEDIYSIKTDAITFGDNVLLDDDPDNDIGEVTNVEGDRVTVRGSNGRIIETIKSKLSKVVGWINTKLGRQIMMDDPPATDIPTLDEPLAPPPPPPPPDRGEDGPLGPLFKKIVSPEYNKLLTRTFISMLETGGVDVDPTQPPFLQVYKALMDGSLRDVDIDSILEQEGIAWEAFSDLMKETASSSGKVLQSYSEIQKFWDVILDEHELTEGGTKPAGGKVGPRLPRDLTALLKLVPIEYQVKRALKGVQSTALGKNWWQRAGNASQKAMLTQLSTFMVNLIHATGQLPLRIVTQGMGAWMHQMREGKGSFRQKLKYANQDTLAAMRAGLEVLVALDPRQVADLLKRNNGRQFVKYQGIINQLKSAFPDIPKKLFALSSGTETLKKGKRELSIAKALIPKVKDAKTREKLLKEITEYDERLRNNVSGLGKFLNGVESVYDAFLQPMQFAEYFLRRPMFVGQLTLELKREGLDLAQVLATGRLDKISPEIMERSVNRALEFTYAYMPGTETGTNYAVEQKIEKAAAHLIEGLNKFGGPLNALFGEPFMKAAFNGAKFVYEYSPVGGILPFKKILSEGKIRPIIADINNKVRLGKMKPGTIEMSGTFTDPVTGKMESTNPTNQEDYDRFAKAMLGTLMYAIVAAMRHTMGGEEWWQIKTGDKSKDGRPIYYDIRRLKPLATMFQLEDLVDRVATGRVGDINVPYELTDIMTGIHMYENQMGGGAIQAAADWFRDEDPGAYGLKVEEQVGKALAVYITPLINLRDAIAQFKEEENIQKDVRGEGIMGPIMDKIPFIRRRLPNLTSPVEPSPIELSEDPGIAQFTGIKKKVGENFAGREWARLGLYNKTFLGRDPDPIINRAQNEAFQKAIDQLGSTFEKEPLYQTASDPVKAMLWEMFIAGDDGLADYAKEIGAMANPEEAIKRSIERGSGMGPLQRKANKFDEILKESLQKK